MKQLSKGEAVLQTQPGTCVLESLVFLLEGSAPEVTLPNPYLRLYQSCDHLGLFLWVGSLNIVLANANGFLFNA